jgi:hypothetical protein
MCETSALVSTSPAIPRMPRHLLPLLLWLVCALVPALLGGDRDRQILALCQEAPALQRQLRKRPRLSRAEGLADDCGGLLFGARW